MSPAPRPASTVLLLRDASSGVEVFLMKRSRESGFMGGAHVFPGGKIDPADAAPEWAAHLQPSPGPLPPSLHVGAIREVFEEAGVLVCAETPPSLTELAAWRRRLLDRQGSFRELAAALSLRFEPRALVPFAHWVTPSAEPRRYDTYFFLAASPPDQEPSIDEHEAVAGGWFTPRGALDAEAEGEIFLAPPTLLCLEALRSIGSVAAALRTRWPTPPIVPKLAEREGRIAIVLPWAPEYRELAGEGDSFDAPEPGAPRRLLLGSPGWTRD